jgi:hypothetical protein
MDILAPEIRALQMQLIKKNGEILEICVNDSD